MDKKFQFYEKLRDEGHNAERAYLISQKRGLEGWDVFHMLVHVYGLSLDKAKEVTITAESKYKSLSEYQEWVIYPALKSVFEIIDKYEKADPEIVVIPLGHFDHAEKT